MFVLTLGLMLATALLVLDTMRNLETLALEPVRIK
jgi:hypothetical protein